MLKDEKTCEDFGRAWYPTTGFGIAGHNGNRGRKTMAAGSNSLTL
jgi:hypothetical protein